MQKQYVIITQTKLNNSEVYFVKYYYKWFPFIYFYIKNGWTECKEEYQSKKEALSAIKKEMEFYEKYTICNTTEEKVTLNQLKGNNHYESKIGI